MRRTKLLSGIISVIAISLLMTGCFGLFGAKEADVTGKVLVDGEAVEGAVVAVAGKSAATSAAGTFTIAKVPTGNQRLTVTIDGEQVYSRQINVVDKGQPITIAIGAMIAYETSFAGGGELGDHGWTAGRGTAAIVEHDGKHWINPADTEVVSSYVTIPEMAGAKKVTVEFTTIALSTTDANGQARWGVNIMANDSSHPHGGNNVFVFFVPGVWAEGAVEHRFFHDSTDKGLEKRSGPDLSRDLNEVVKSKTIIDFENNTIDFYANGVQQNGYPFDAGADLLSPMRDNTLLRVYANNTDALFTDFKVTVEN